MQSSCDGRLNCSFNVNSATFGTTDCGGGENLFVEYECCKSFNPGTGRRVRMVV